MRTAADVVFGFCLGFGLAGLSQAAWLLWSARPRGVRWPRNYRVICTECSLPSRGEATRPEPVADRFLNGPIE